MKTAEFGVSFVIASADNLKTLAPLRVSCEKVNYQVFV